MRTKAKVLIGSTIAVGLIGSAVGVSVAATSGDGHETPLRGSALEQATTAALAHIGGGTVIETETGDDGAAYGVEIRNDDGSVVEVQLDDNFTVTGVEHDDDGAPDQAGSEEG